MKLDKKKYPILSDLTEAASRTEMRTLASRSKEDLASLLKSLENVTQHSKNFSVADLNKKQSEYFSAYDQGIQQAIQALKAMIAVSIG